MGRPHPEVTIDHFYRLGVSWDATEAEIRAAYERLSAELPRTAPYERIPRGQVRRARTLGELAESWAILGDPVYRDLHRAQMLDVNEWRRARTRRPPPLPKSKALAAAAVGAAIAIVVKVLGG